MPELSGGDARFPRARCELCEKLCVLSQIADYIMTRLADGKSKQIALCDRCASEPSLCFAFKKLLQ